MRVALDPDGQPLNTNLNSHGRVTRAMSELIGFLRGVNADRRITADECTNLAVWIAANEEIIEVWPACVLAERLSRIYADAVVTDEELVDLGELVNELLGRQDSGDFSFCPTDLPLTKPEPDVLFANNEFVLTGKFLYGVGKACEKEIETRGGMCSPHVRVKTNYLVIGSRMSRDWKFTTHGTEIEAAVHYSARYPIAIVSEKHWQSFLKAS